MIDIISKIIPRETRLKNVVNCMNDVTTQVKVEKLAYAIMSFPFKKQEDIEVHYRTVLFLNQYKQYSPAYAAFLLKSLAEIDLPDINAQALDIIHYLREFGPETEVSWNDCFQIAARSKNSLSFLGILLADKKTVDGRIDKTTPNMQKRVEALIQQSEKGLFGRPVSVQPSDMFMAIMRKFSELYLGLYGDSQSIDNIIEMYREYGSKYSSVSDSELLMIMVSIYRKCSAGESKEEVLGWIIDLFKRFTDLEELADNLVSFISELYRERESEEKTGVKENQAVRVLKRLADECGTSIAQLIPLSHLGTEAIFLINAFCLEFGIKVEGIVPTLDELILRLSNDDNNEKMKAIRLLKVLGPDAKQAEPSLLKLFRWAESRADYDSHIKYLKSDIILLLGTISSGNSESLTIMISYLKDRNSVLSNAAFEALVCSGESAVPAIKEEFIKENEQYVQANLIRVFKQRGKASSSNLGWLNDMFDKAGVGFLRNEIEDAIAAISR